MYILLLAIPLKVSTLYTFSGPSGALSIQVKDSNKHNNNINFIEITIPTSVR